MSMKNKKGTKENWIEKIKCKRENHEDQLCGGCKDCQVFWGLKSLIESILEFEKTKDRQKFIDALIWCSGSEDFQIGGKARRGWEKICLPLLKDEK